MKRSSIVANVTFPVTKSLMFLFLTMDHNFLVPNSTSFPKLTGLITILAVHTYPQSNGKAEKAVQTTKSLLQKALSEKKDFQLALLDFRNTPTNDVLGSPAQRLTSHGSYNKDFVTLNCWRQLSKSSIKSYLR